MTTMMHLSPYYYSNYLIIEYPTEFTGIPKSKVTGRLRIRVLFTYTMGKRITFKSRGDRLKGKLGKKGYKLKYNSILVGSDAEKKDFLEAIKECFSEKLQVRPQSLHFRWEEPMPFGDLQ